MDSNFGNRLDAMKEEKRLEFRRILFKLSLNKDNMKFDSYHYFVALNAFSNGFYDEKDIERVFNAHEERFISFKKR
ncbi:hypothetical protein HY061_02490 [Candidatus Azambacteria bacterium]|nr:hypothetical protein [Candidatus Azambacteria bacterium]